MSIVGLDPGEERRWREGGKRGEEGQRRGEIETRETEGGVMLDICLIIHHTKSLIGRRGRCVCLIQQAFRRGVKDLLYPSGICFSNCRKK